MNPADVIVWLLAVVGAWTVLETVSDELADWLRRFRDERRWAIVQHDARARAAVIARDIERSRVG